MGQLRAGLLGVTTLATLTAAYISSEPQYDATPWGAVHTKEETAALQRTAIDRSAQYMAEESYEFGEQDGQGSLDYMEGTAEPNMFQDYGNFQNGGQHQKRFGSPSGHMSQEQLRLAYLRQQQQQQKQHESVLQSQNGFGHQAGDDFFASAADGLQYIEDDIEVFEEAGADQLPGPELLQQHQKPEQQFSGFRDFKAFQENGWTLENSEYEDPDSGSLFPGFEEQSDAMPEYPAMPTLQPEASVPPAAAAGQPKYPHSSQTFPHQIYNSDPTSQGQGTLPGQSYNPQQFLPDFNAAQEQPGFQLFNEIGEQEEINQDHGGYRPEPQQRQQRQQHQQQQQQLQQMMYGPEFIGLMPEQPGEGKESKTIMKGGGEKPKSHTKTYSHEHSHDHKSEHQHGHQHGHEHKNSHSHAHKHEHTASAEHGHNHTHGHEHGHEHKHGHAHKADHKHLHSHQLEHKHGHKHAHKAGHKHLHQHKQDHQHEHAHKGEHKHHHMHEHHHHHHHKHSHSSEHKHGHEHKHDHKGIY